jgi:hypothetical protein
MPDAAWRSCEDCPEDAFYVAKAEAAGFDGEAADAGAACSGVEVAGVEPEETARDVAIEEAGGGAVAKFRGKTFETPEDRGLDLRRRNCAEAGAGEPDGTELDASEIAAGGERGDYHEAFALNARIEIAA